MDLGGPLTPSLTGKTMQMIIKDDATRFRWMFALRGKTAGEVLGMFDTWRRKVEKQSGRTVKIVRSDNGGEFVSFSFNKYFKELGIIHQTTIPHSPMQNGVAEREMRILEESITAMLLDSGLSKGYWELALAYTTYIQNCLPVKRLGDLSPVEAWSGRRPDLRRIKTFGCKAAVKILPGVKKHNPKTRMLTFIGHSLTQKAWLFTDGRTITSSDSVKFFELTKSGMEVDQKWMSPDSVVAENVEDEDEDEDEQAEDVEDGEVSKSGGGGGDVPPGQIQASPEHRTVPTPPSYIPKQAGGRSGLMPHGLLKNQWQGKS